MSDDFGDIEDDDVIGTEPADPEQVARKLHELRHENGLETVDWDALAENHRALRILIVGLLLAWLRRQGSNF